MPVLKGFCTGAKTSNDARKLASLEVDWFYTWGSVPNLATPVNDFTPMIWGRNGATAENIKAIDAKYPQYSNTYLLGFNEPDLASQANMSVDEALRLWPILEQSRAKLVSPATTQPRSAWMADFMSRALAQGRQIDAVALHIYQSPDVGTFLKKVDEAHEKWGKNIWITETSVADWDAITKDDNRFPREQVNDYLRGIWEGVQARPYVTRFSWKTRAWDDPTMGTAAFFDLDGNRTSTAKLYTSLT